MSSGPTATEEATWDTGKEATWDTGTVEPQWDVNKQCDVDKQWDAVKLDFRVLRGSAVKLPSGRAGP